MKSKEKELLKIIVCVIPAVFYIIWFVMNVHALASQHLEQELFYPIIMCVISVLLLAVFGILYWRNKISNVLVFGIPFIYFVSSLITFFIGYNVACCIGG